jgi:hypothetical protein
MSNHHLRNKALSLKAKGLLSQMLSLPDTWDYTLKGLSFINSESVEAVRTAVLELEAAGYVVRRQTRSGDGRMGPIEYTIYEQPQEPDAPPPVETGAKPPSCDFPTSDNPTSDKPLSVLPTSENPTQLNKETTKKDELNKEPINPILSPVDAASDGIDMDGDGIDMDGGDDFQNVEKALRKNTRIDRLLESHPDGRDVLREIFGLALDTATSGKRRIAIAGGHYSPEFVRERLLRLTDHHLLYVLDCLKANTTKIRNIKAYMLASLINAPLTIDSYYTTLVSHDKAHGLI